MTTPVGMIFPGSFRPYGGDGMPVGEGATVTADNVTSQISANVPPINVTLPPQQYFTAEQLEAARQQEKDKLYGRMTTLEETLNGFKTEVETLRAAREAAEQLAQTRQAEADAAAKKAEDEKLSVQELLAKRDAEWQQQQADLTQKIETERAIMAKERELQSLAAYIQRRVAEEIASDGIIPDLVEYITGASEEEVEASITKAKEKTASIIAGATRMGGAPTPPPVAPGVSPTGFAPTGPLDTLSGQQQYSADDISKMSLSDYAKFRAQAGIDRAGNNKGLFG
jgi:hypothetical protein